MSYSSSNSSISTTYCSASGFSSYNLKKKEYSNLFEKYFGLPPNPNSVTNKNFINVSGPIGVNTGVGLKIPNYNIRRAPPCPKFVISPFLRQ